MAALRLNKQLFNPALYARVREVWFQGLPENSTTAPPELYQRWYGMGAHETDRSRFDALCTSDFRAALDSIGPAACPLPAAGSWGAEQQQAEALAAPFLAECDAGRGSTTPPEADGDRRDPAPAGVTTALSLMLLLDQMPRNIFRERQSVIYAHYDRISRALLHSLLRRSPRPDLDASLRYAPALRSWFYMPLMHSEHLEDHARFQELAEGLKEDVMSREDAAAVGAVEQYLGYEKRHADIIERFGRYPHRNEHLGRDPTAEESKFLETGGDSFTTGRKS